MKTIFQKTIWLVCITFAFTSCSKEKEEHSENSDECWYKVTIDGQTTLPNQFGQDKIAITSGVDIEDGETGFGFHLSQAKGDGTRNANHLVAAIYGLLNQKSPSGTYPVHTFASLPFNTSSYETNPVYVFGEEADSDGANVIFNLLENSDRRIRVMASGTAVRRDTKTGDDTGIVPVEVEIVVGRKHVVEVPINDVVVSGGSCDCREQ